MDPENKSEGRRGHGHGQSHGPSSAWLHDPKTVLGRIPLAPGQAVADLGCGAADYTLEAAKMVGPQGRVYAIDKWAYMIEKLSQIIESSGLVNITPLTADITAPLPLEEGGVDVVFIATVLHIFDLKQAGPSIFSECRRILKPGGLLAVVECKKEDQPFGPPKEMRNTPEDIETAVLPFGFEKKGYHDLGYNYLIQFIRK